MPSFTYKSLNGSGQPLSGTIAAPDRASAIRILMARGETPTRVDEGAGEAVAKRVGASLLSRNRNPRLKRTETATLFRELATAVEAGLPLASALRTVRKQAHGKALPVILDHLIERIEAGTPMHQAAAEYGAPFDDMIIGMLRAADASGEMSDVLHQLADLLERSVELRRAVTGALVYPMILLVLVSISVFILVTYLVPSLLKPLEGQIEMPLPTLIVLGIADFTSTYWGVIVLGFIGLFVGWRFWVNVPENRLRFDRWKLRMPIAGRVLRDVAVARFTRTLGTLTTAGLPILNALRITRDTLVNAALMNAIDEVEDQVTAGKPLAEPLEQSGLFPPLLIQIVNLGERSGRLEQMLLHASNAFDRQVNNSIRIFTSMLQPVLVVIMAIIGAFVLAAILLPLLELQSIISG